MSEPIDVNFKDEPAVHGAKAPAGIVDTNKETWYGKLDSFGDVVGPFVELTDGGYISEADENVARRDIDDAGGWLQIPQPTEPLPAQLKEMPVVSNDITTPDYTKYPTDCPNCGAKRGYPCDPEAAALSLHTCTPDWEEDHSDETCLACHYDACLYTERMKGKQ